MSRYSAAKAAIRRPGLRYGAQCPTTRRRRATTRTTGAQHSMRQGPVFLYKVCIVIGGDDREAVTRLSVVIQCATRPARLATQPATSHDTVEHRPTTRPRRPTWVQCAQAGSGCAPGAPNPVLTQCIILNHCLGHCS